MNHQVQKQSNAKKLMFAAGVSAALLCAAVTFYLVWPSSPPPPPSKSVKFEIFVDQSASIPSIQQEQWVLAVDKLFGRLGSGDGVVIYGMHDQTLNASPIYKADVPILPPNPGYEILEGWKRRLNQIRRDAKAALAQALNPRQRALRTDIFSAFNRVQPDPKRQTIIVFLSDMLNSTPELDMEKTRLSDSDISKRLSSIAAKHQWKSGMLGGAKVHCILNSVEIRAVVTPLNDRLALGQFWEALLKELGASVETFETHLDLN